MEAEPVALLSSAEIRRDELVTFLHQAGAAPVESAYRIFDYILKSGEAYFWIDLDDVEQYPDPEIDALIAQKLGGGPRTRVMLHVKSASPESERLAIEFALQFARHWPCIIDNLSGFARHIYSVQELAELQRQGRGVWDEDRTAHPPEDSNAGKAYLPAWLEPHLSPEEKNDPGFVRETNLEKQEQEHE
jgi:hypothetical protein